MPARGVPRAAIALYPGSADVNPLIIKPAGGGI